MLRKADNTQRVFRVFLVRYRRENFAHTTVRKFVRGHSAGSGGGNNFLRNFAMGFERDYRRFFIHFFSLLAYLTDAIRMPVYRYMLNDSWTISRREMRRLLSPRIADRVLSAWRRKLHPWSTTLVQIRQGGRGSTTLYDRESVRKCYALIVAGTAPPLLPSEMKSADTVLTASNTDLPL